MFKKLFAALLSLGAAAAFAAVDVNKATQAELESVKGIGPSISGRILDERRKSPFKDWSDMTDRVKGVGEHNAARFSKDGLTVNGAAFAGTPGAAKQQGKPTPKRGRMSGKAAAGTAASAPASTAAQTRKK